jgi:hypothetical protein
VIGGSLAASAPLRYHPGLYDGTQSGAFYAVCTRDFAKKNSDCPALVRSAFVQIGELFQTEQGREQLSQELGLCTPIGAGAENQRLLNLWIENAFASLGMENYPYSIGDLPPYPMEAACEVMSANASPSNLVCYFFINANSIIIIRLLMMMMMMMVMIMMMISML